jgi:uncharacterized protein YcbK (DUF882 family)
VKLSPNFHRFEMACKCGCGYDTVDAELLAVLQKLRDHFGVPVRITSGTRCPAHNRIIQGSADSMHLRGRAADIQLTGILAASVADYLEQQYPDRYGIGRYRDFTHIDTRSGPLARWRG